MATLNISLPDSLREFVDKQVAKGGYSTASEYMRELVRKAARDSLEAKLLEGLNSGPGIVADDKFWAERRAKLIAAHANRSKSKIHRA
ncbi:MAG: type II toxin-antitoxin system ParD family antitoxin [Phycisphaerae bacterium]|nr:type II toxin-antitoxin system ParD family antitoxin [Phycisphaerae bacterium]